MSDLREFAGSSNGDRWYLADDVDEPYVLHQANLPSGGHQTLTPVPEFLTLRPFGPEREALLALLEEQKGREEQHDTGLDRDG